MARLSKQDVKSKVKKVAKPKKAVTKPGQVKSAKKPAVKPGVEAVKVTKPTTVLKKKEALVSRPVKIPRHKPPVLEKIIPKAVLKMPPADVAGAVIRPPKRNPLP